MNPTISIPNLGIDTNVFNDPPSVTPRRDFTFTITPRADMWLRLGRTWLSGAIVEDIVWYQTYRPRRAANQALLAGLESAAQPPGAELEYRLGAHQLAPRVRNRHAGAAQRARLRGER